MALLLLGVGLAVLLSLIMTAAWAIALATGKSGWVDTIWSYATGVAGAIGALHPLEGTLPDPRQWLCAGLCLVWSIRLGSHIARRTLGGEDDPRYAKLKADWGADYRRQFFVFLQIQAIAALVLAVAVMLAARAPGAHLTAFDALGLLIGIVAIGGETLADAQLQRFRDDATNRGRICEVGLWSWSRHPNYFFEWLSWASFPVIAISGGLQYWPGVLTLLAPVQMYWLLVHVSGIPPLEDHMRRSRPAAFEPYAARVSLFWPRPPKPI